MSDWYRQQEQMAREYQLGQQGWNIPTISGQRGFNEYRDATQSQTFEWPTYEAPTYDNSSYTPSYSSSSYSSSSSGVSPATLGALALIGIGIFAGVQTQNVVVAIATPFILLGLCKGIVWLLKAFFATPVGQFTKKLLVILFWAGLAGGVALGIHAGAGWYGVGWMVLVIGVVAALIGTVQFLKWFFTTAAGRAVIAAARAVVLTAMGCGALWLLAKMFTA